VDAANRPQRDHRGMWRASRLPLSLLHDRDSEHTHSFRAIIASGQVEPLVLPARSPNLNAYAERRVRSVKEECLSKVVLFGERSLRRAQPRAMRATVLIRITVSCRGPVSGRPASHHLMTHDRCGSQRVPHQHCACIPQWYRVLDIAKSSRRT
jgi:transposase InsO family protein